MGGINSICINWVSVQKNLGQHPLGTKQTARNNDGSVLRGCRRKAGFPCDRLVIEKKEKKRKETNREKEKKKKKTYLDSCVDIAIYCFSKNIIATASVN